MIRANGFLGNIRWFFRGYNSITRIKTIESRDELPRKIGRTLIVVGTEKPKWAILQCPCGCGDRIEVNLMRSRSPFWNLELGEQGASLYPSLWRSKATCGSHFWLRSSQIQWV